MSVTRVLAVALGVLCMPPVMVAQQPVGTTRAFMLSLAGTEPIADVQRLPLALRTPVTVQLKRVTVERALREIIASAHLNLSYSRAIVPLERVVTVDVRSGPVVEALRQAVGGAPVELWLAANGKMALVPANESPTSERTAGMLTGHITERGANTPIASAQVTIVGAGLTRYTDDKGQYRIPNVPAGDHEVSIRRLGFEVVSRKIRLGDGETVTLDVAMSRVATALTEVVTTATGERSRLEVGNSIGTIKADSLVPTTLIRDMSDLLTARTPGVVVNMSSGMIGAPTFVRIRGMASASLSNDPVIVLDGIRLTPASYAGKSVDIGGIGLGGNFSAQIPGTNRLDDLDPNVIESIDVLRGPSASSLYGTDAAAGVIVIRTKKGVAGPFRFNLLADQGQSHVLGTFPLEYVGFGHLANGTPTAQCFLYRQSTANVEDHTCVQDSVRAYDPFNNPRLNMLGTGMARNFSANLSGGMEQVREFLSLRVSDVVGLARLSPAEQDRVARMWGEAAPSWVRHPNTEQNMSTSSRTNLQIAHGLDLSLTANGLYRNTLGGGPGGVLGSDNSGGASGAGQSRSLYDTLVYLPAETQRARGMTTAKRGYGAAGGTYTPVSWLVLRGTLGGDYTLRTSDQLTRAADCTAVLNPNGCSSQHINIRTETFVTTVDVGAQATWLPRTWLSLRTSTGEQLNRVRTYNLQAGNGSSTSLAFGTDLLSPNPVSTTAGVQLFNISESRDENATAGWYLEETASLQERFFLTAAFRQDVASAFGSRVNDKAPIYPKYSLSWLVSEEPFFPKTSFISSLRLRTACGHSGQEARQTAVLNNYVINSASVDGVLGPSIGLQTIGNPTLRPERTAEFEGGFDLSLMENERVHLEATAYRKLSHDAITTQTLPASLGGNANFNSSFSESVNLGSVENRGWELSVAAKLIEKRSVTWELTVNASRNTNRLVSAATGANNLAKSGCQGSFPPVGYPLQSCFGYAITGYADFNGDGILERNEVQFDPTLRWLGSINPESELTYTNTVQFYGGALRFNAKLDQVNGLVSTGFGLTSLGASVTSPQLFLPVSLAQQAATLLAFNNLQGYIGKANIVRLAELSVTATVPKTIVSRFLRAQTASVTLAGRNLAMWTNSADKDPINNQDASIAPDVNLTSRGGVPTPRDVTFRINLGY